MTFEKIWYESSPYLYLGAGIAATFSSNRFAVVFGVLLVCVSGTILYMRRNYRKNRPPD